MKKEEEFFDKVEEVLHAYTETYEEGAWEDFEKHRKKEKKVWLFRPWAAVAAAVILIAVYGLFELTDTGHLKEQTIAKKIDKQLPEKAISQIHIDTQINAKKTTQSETRIAKQFNNKMNDVKIGSLNELAITVKDVNPNPRLNEVVIANTAQNQVQKPSNAITLNNEEKQNVIAVIPATQKNNIDKNTVITPPNRYSAGAYDSLVNKNATVIAKTKNNDRNFTYSVLVAPSLSNQKVNFGAGMEISYKLGSRFSINSGVIYNELNAKSGGRSLSSANQFAQNADLAVSGIEVPLGLQYQISNGFYASVGVSGMSLLSNRLEYSYQEDRVASMPVMNDNGTSQLIGLVSELKTAQAKEDLNNYIGFFTISAGKKQAFGKSNLNIGPFLKIPFNSVSTEKIKLLQGGFRLSFDF